MGHAVVLVELGVGLWQVVGDVIGIGPFEQDCPAIGGFILHIVGQQRTGDEAIAQLRRQGAIKDCFANDKADIFMGAHHMAIIFVAGDHAADDLAFETHLAAQ